MSRSDYYRNLIGGGQNDFSEAGKLTTSEASSRLIESFNEAVVQPVARH